jgi:hypothetical protein
MRYNWWQMQARTVERLVPKQAVAVSCENNTVVRYNWCHMQARTVERLVPKQPVDCEL